MTEPMSQVERDQVPPYPGWVPEGAADLEETWADFVEAWRQVRRGIDLDRPAYGARLHAYADPHVEGQAAGWLGGPFLADWVAEVIERLRQLATGAEEEDDE